MVWQVPFQPGSTPDVKGRRYLGADPSGVHWLLAACSRRVSAAWNMLGCVVSREDVSYRVVEVEFSDTTRFKNHKIVDTYGYTMAALGPRPADTLRLLLTHTACAVTQARTAWCWPPRGTPK